VSIRRGNVPPLPGVAGRLSTGVSRAEDESHVAAIIHRFLLRLSDLQTADSHERIVERLARARSLHQSIREPVCQDRNQDSGVVKLRKAL
jgi:hypothetical protein